MTPSKKLESEVIKTTKQLLELNGERDEKYTTLYKKLNLLIYKIYEFSNEEIKIIENILKETLSKKQYYGTTNE